MQLAAGEKSYRAIREKLESGELAPGDKLVTRTLADEFGVSLSPVREAISRLSTEGLVRHTPGAGAEVKRLDLDELNELYVLRDAVESCAAGLAAELGTAEDWETLSYLIDQQELIATQLAATDRNSATKRQLTHWIELEERFHENVIRCSRNKLLAKVIRDQRTMGRVFELHLYHGMSPNAPLLTAEVAHDTVAGKRQLLQYFEKQDVRQASQTMSQMITEGRRHVIRILREQGW